MLQMAQTETRFAPGGSEMRLRSRINA